MTGDRTPDERRVSDALHDTVDDLEPIGGLTSIRARLQEDAMSSSPRPFSRNTLLALGGAAAAVAIVTTGIVLVTQDDGRPSSDPPPAGSTSQTPAPTDDPTDDATDPTPEPTDSSTPAPSTSTRSLPVYYVGDTPTGPRLYREFHRVEVVAGDELGRAVQQAVEAPPLDPDYRTPWPAGTTADATSLSSEQVIVVDLSNASSRSLHDRPAGMSRAEAQMAIEQLIYTAQAAVQARTPVRFVLDGNLSDQVLGVPTSEPLANGDEMSTLATVWIQSPQDGDAFNAGDVRVTGRGAFFEATVVWQLLQGDTVVANGSAMAQECCTLSPYDFTIKNVQPGDYVLRVYDEDMSGGEGPGEAEDTKRITVE